MAYINVAEWSSDQVTDWLKGLDNAMYHYLQSFTNNEVGGSQLLNIRPYELEQLGMHSIGHQEIVLEAVETLKNFNYHLDKENLQFLALHLATTSKNLYKQLLYHTEKKKIETQILKDVTRTIATIKPLVSWLDRTPFQGQIQYEEVRRRLLKFGLEMATSAQRDRFVENPVDQIKDTADKLSKLADYIIQDISDPMILQPSTLDLVTLKKRENELGFFVLPSYHGVHRIMDIKFNSPARNSGKIEEGDEIVQINYQTVVGWEYKKVMMLLQDSSPDVLLTLKKRPKHTKIYGQIYIKPYRLPSKKHYRWGESLPSPRAEFFPLPQFSLPLQKVPEKHGSSDSESGSSDILTPTDAKQSNKETRIYMPKPRAVLQRRHTLSNFKDLNTVQSWSKKPIPMDTQCLREKCVSFGHGLQMARRPTTCLGITNSSTTGFTGLKGSLPDIIQEPNNNSLPSQSVGDDGKSDCDENFKPGVSKVVRFDSNLTFEKCHIDTKYTCNVDNTVLETFEPIPYVDEEVPPVNVIERVKKFESLSKANAKPITPSQPTIKEGEVVEAINEVLVKKETTKRGRLDKSYSTPDYDDGDLNDLPPAIEPRKEHLHKTPPAPPPRPRKTLDNAMKSSSPSTPTFVTHHTQNSMNEGTIENKTENKSKMANVVDLKVVEAAVNNNQSAMATVTQVTKIESPTVVPLSPPLSPPLRPMMMSPQLRKVPPARHFREPPIESLELLTPSRTKILTLKKKNSLMNKRRKVSLKTLCTSDIQGHLYRRAKDKNGLAFWAKHYFVLIDTALYGFKKKESQKANSLIFLSGFTVSLATEVHSKPFAFKVYHQLKSFYFAAETNEALNQWMEFIRQATLKGNTNMTAGNVDYNIKELYSETESDDDDDFTMDISSSKSSLYTPSPLSNSNSNQSSRASDSNDQNSTPTTTKHEKYHLNFGSLKKFTKTNLPFSTENSGPSEGNKFFNFFSSHKGVEKSNSSELPVPTASFRSYRKVPGHSGLQIGTNSASTEKISVPLTPIMPFVESEPPPPPPQSAKPLPSPLLEPEITITEELDDPPSTPKRDDDDAEMLNEAKKTKRTPPHNFIHASNPNLVEFDFQTSKCFSGGFSVPKIHLTNNWEPHQVTNLTGMMTLKDLMLQKQKEEAQDMYDKRVCLGVEKIDDTTLKKNLQKDVKPEVPENVPKIQQRRLPITPDYAQSFKPDDQDILYTRSKEGQKLRDFGYELISGDDSFEAKNNLAASRIAAANAANGSSSGTQTFPEERTFFRKKMSLNWINTDKKQEDNGEKSTRESFKRSKNKAVVKLDNIKASSEKLFQFKHSNNDKESLKSKHTEKSTSSLSINLKPQNFAAVSQNMTLPLNRSSEHNVMGIKKSNTCNNSSDFKENSNKVMQNVRKNSAPDRTASYFTKLSFTSNKTVKEKKFLGSPKLHRAIFGKNQQNDLPGTVIDHEVFSPISYTKQCNTLPQEPSTSVAINQTLILTTTTTSSNKSSPDYPNMEYPPVFEPETYSLVDPNTSMTLLKRRHQNK